MENIITNISSFIYELAVQENDELLSLTDQGAGLKQMPELAFAYLCGKEIFRQRQVILGSKDFEWVREEDIGGGGPSDLVFISNDNKLKNIVIEFKLDDTYHSYKADIEKLSLVDPIKYVRLFCSFKWVYEDQIDEFENILHNKFPENAVLIDSKNFKTVINSKDRDYFLYTMWEVT